MNEQDPGTARVLVVAGVFSAGHADPWLLDDLVSEFARLGAHVDVIAHDMKQARSTGPGESTSPNVRVWSAGPTKRHESAIGKLYDYASTGLRLHTSAYRFVRRARYDLCVFTSIGAFSFGFPRRVRRAGIASSLLFVLWDFFPVHQLEVGRIKLHWLHGPLRALERFAIAASDTIAVMTPRNAEFLRAYHPGLEAEVVIVPPWAPPLDPSRAPRAVAKFDTFTVLFGGQLVHGRGVETLLDAAAQLLAEDAPVTFIIAGWGSDAARLRREAGLRGLSNVGFVERLPRDRYLELASRAHVGVAATVPGVSVPSFPSKIVDYCRMGLPVICSIESTSDAGELVSRSGAGISVVAGDPEASAAAVRQMLREHLDGVLDERSASARRFFEDSLSVERAAARLLSAARPR